MTELHLRKIIHIDMDAFFASVEQRDNPALRGKPIAVGGNHERGVIAAASYEARKFGVKSAMPSAIAAKRCPELIFVKHRFDRYKEVSAQVRAIFHEYTDLVEPLSIDEAYLDVTENKIGLNSATLIAKQIKQRIFEVTQLTASAGVSYNKFLAKMASDMDKPNGIFVILPHEAEAILQKLPVHRFHGIGQATAEKMKLAGIFTGNDLRKKSKEDLIRRYGKAGNYYFHICRGEDNRAVIPSRERKSVSAERTFDQNLFESNEVINQITEIAKMTFSRYAKTDKKGKTVTLKIKYGDFRQITRSHTCSDAISTLEALTQPILSLFNESLLAENGIRLIGVGISNFENTETITWTPKQLTLDF